MSNFKRNKPNELITRTLSGIIYAGFILLSLGTNSPYPFFVVFTIFYLLSISEVIKIWRIPRYFGFSAAAFWLMNAVPFFKIPGLSFGSQAALMITLTVYIAGLIFYTFFKHDLQTGMRFAGAFLYLAVPLTAVVFILLHPGGTTLILTVFVLIWANDTLAYLSGKNFGKHRLAPSISPKKTLEGLIGGIAGTIVVAFLLRHAGLALPDNNLTLLAWALSVSVLATLGDLFESYLKRKSGLKDSGTIIPGHGGILDRLDSFFFVIPALFVYLILV